MISLPISSPAPRAQLTRKLRPVDFVAPLILATAFLLPLPKHGKIGALPNLCPFFALTNFPCPFCGLTRSVVCGAHGHWHEAFQFHWLGPLFLLACVAACAISSTRSLSERRLQLSAKWRKFAWQVLFAATMLTWLARLAGRWPLPQ